MNKNICYYNCPETLRDAQKTKQTAPHEHAGKGMQKGNKPFKIFKSKIFHNGFKSFKLCICRQIPFL